MSVQLFSHSKADLEKAVEIILKRNFWNTEKTEECNLCSSITISIV